MFKDNKDFFNDFDKMHSSMTKKAIPIILMNLAIGGGSIVGTLFLVKYLFF